MQPKQVEESIVSAASACCTRKSPMWDQVRTEIQQHLEVIRAEEMRRRAGKLRGMSKEQRAMLDQLTRSLMRRAVVERIEEALKEPGGISREGSEVIREMFAARHGRLDPPRTRGIARPGRRDSMES